ncbi:YjcZ family sporulation protein [Virgibacillus kekensis]|uniref:YjcZ family sporulation protein n=1 Tax=Virgibacillus kekensis TaxID=202261 RepID=A0ABV9DGC2_9BACI
MGYSGVWGNNGFVLLVVLFILLIIIGNSYHDNYGY